MTFKQVDDFVASIGLPYAYYQFTEETAEPCPFLCFYFTGSEDLAADNSNYQKIRPLIIELYTDSKDFALENRIEAALNGAGLVFERDESWIDTERMNMVSYTVDVVITEEED